MFVEEKTQGELPAKLDDVSTLLLKTAAVVEKLGWCQNKLTTHDGRVCLVGAIHFANLGRQPEPAENPWLIGVADKAFHRMMRALGESPPEWNDKRSRTEGEVVAKLRAVALGL